MPYGADIPIIRGGKYSPKPKVNTCHCVSSRIGSLILFTTKHPYPSSIKAQYYLPPEDDAGVYCHGRDVFFDMKDFVEFHLHLALEVNNRLYIDNYKAL